LKCAITIQELMRERCGRRIEFRIGITHVELLSGEDRIEGDAIKIVSRLVDLCEPGGICVTDKLYNELEVSFDVEYLDIGEQNLHDIAKPVRVFRINLTRPLPNGRQPLSNRPAWRNPRWIIAVLGVLSVAIGLGSMFTWWDLRTPTQGENRISHSRSDGPDFHADPSKQAAANSAAANEARGTRTDVPPVPSVTSVTCGPDEVETLGVCMHSIAGSESMRTRAANQEIPLPPAIVIRAPGPSIRPELGAYVGAWGGDNRWNGRGRHMLLVVTHVSSRGDAYGVLGLGPAQQRLNAGLTGKKRRSTGKPSSKHTQRQEDPATYTRFMGAITQNGLEFTVRNGSNYTFLRRKDDTVTGFQRSPDAEVAAINIQRLE
jgi:hypothetical protein